ncbi:hypothetical protein OIU76_015868 [Salix suchowensis]|nr:hypothetical protein OIU76_015868 [Salix suchowensis]
MARSEGLESIVHLISPSLVVVSSSVVSPLPLLLLFFAILGLLEKDMVIKVASNVTGFKIWRFLRNRRN